VQRIHNFRVRGKVVSVPEHHIMKAYGEMEEELNVF
jgi:hypothetical protein